jgi:hypothetical protein
MQDVITVLLPTELKQALDDVTRQEGISADEFVGEAIQQHLFSRRFRLLRERLLPKAQAQGVLTDQDVFDRVS